MPTEDAIEPHEEDGVLDPTSAAVREALDGGLQRLTSVELDDLLATLTGIAQRDGILALASLCPDDDQDLLVNGIRMAIDGPDPATLRDTLERLEASLMHQHRVLYAKAIVGIMALQCGEGPTEVRERLEPIR